MSEKVKMSNDDGRTYTPADMAPIADRLAQAALFSRVSTTTPVESDPSMWRRTAAMVAVVVIVGSLLLIGFVIGRVMA